MKCGQCRGASNVRVTVPVCNTVTPASGHRAPLGARQVTLVGGTLISCVIASDTPPLFAAFCYTLTTIIDRHQDSDFVCSSTTCLSYDLRFNTWQKFQNVIMSSLENSLQKCVLLKLY